MPRRTKKLVDRVARLTLDLPTTNVEEITRLRGLLYATNQIVPSDKNNPQERLLAGLKVDKTILGEIEQVELKSADTDKPPILAARRDLQEDLVSGRFVGPLTALGGAERLGPFVVNDRPVYFDFWREARRIDIVEDGVALPAFVISSARRQRISLGRSSTLKLQKGTVWIRGDLVNAQLPAGAYVGVTVSDGKLALPSVLTQTEGQIVVSSPLNVTLTLILASEQGISTDDGCQANTELQLPSITMLFASGRITVNGDPASAKVWGQSFEFSGPTGSIKFLSQQWSLLIGYNITPTSFDGNLIDSKIADFQGTPTVTEASLFLPVVQAAPSLLGTSSVEPRLGIVLQKLEARWYSPDNRFHLINPWLIISNRSVTLFDDAVAPLDVPVETTYRLWELPDRNGKRLPWRHSYHEPFMFRHLCDNETGESLDVTGNARIDIDRPLDAYGSAIQIPSGEGLVYITAKSNEIRIFLNVNINKLNKTLLVLQNALVWTTGAYEVRAEGELINRVNIDNGKLPLRFGVYAWAPTLPDPYVSNYSIRQPDITVPQSILDAHIKWTVSESIPKVEFSGSLGLPKLYDASSIILSEDNLRKYSPAIGLTQTEQGELSLDEDLRNLRNKKRQTELRGRESRAKSAADLNATLERAIKNYYDEFLGDVDKPFILLDLSTNQDLLGVGLPRNLRANASLAGGSGLRYPVEGIEVSSTLESMRLVTLPQIQWEPVRTLEVDQNIAQLDWFPSPLASTTDGGATILGAKSQILAPINPRQVLAKTKQVFDEGINVIFRTTLPFGLVTVVKVQAEGQITSTRKPDSYEITEPNFIVEDNQEGKLEVKGGLQITVKAENGEQGKDKKSSSFEGRIVQLKNGVDLSGAPLGLSVLSAKSDPVGDVESIFNRQMEINPIVPVTRFDLSGYGGSNFSDWNDPFARFGETAKVQFQVIGGRTTLEIVKVMGWLYPWMVKSTRSVIVERTSGGGVIRRDTGWQAITEGICDSRYADADEVIENLYDFDGGIFKGFFNIRQIRPAPGLPFSTGDATFAPYYFDADLVLDGLKDQKRVPVTGVLSWLQVKPTSKPVTPDQLRSLIKAQGPPGGSLEAWIEFGTSRLPFRARRIEIDVVDNPITGRPTFVATVRGVPKLPNTGAWSVVQRNVKNVLGGSGEAVPVSETKGVPVIRRYPIQYPLTKQVFSEPPLMSGSLPGDWRMADPADLFSPGDPENDYCFLQNTPTHAFLYPRPVAEISKSQKISSTVSPEIADIFMRSTSKGAFPPRPNNIRLDTTLEFNVINDSLELDRKISLSPIKSLWLAGQSGQGTQLTYDNSSIEIEISSNNWSAKFDNLRLWSDIAGFQRANGAQFNLNGSSRTKSQVTKIRPLLPEKIENLLSLIPGFTNRQEVGPIELSATNAKHEIKIGFALEVQIPPNSDVSVWLGLGASIGYDFANKFKKALELFAVLRAEFPIYGVPAFVHLELLFSAGIETTFAISNSTLNTSTGIIPKEKLELALLVGVGKKQALYSAYFGIGIYLPIPFKTFWDLGLIVRAEGKIKIKIAEVKLKLKLSGEAKGKLDPDQYNSKKFICSWTLKVKINVEIAFLTSINTTYSISDSLPIGG